MWRKTCNSWPPMEWLYAEHSSWNRGAVGSSPTRSALISTSWNSVGSIAVVYSPKWVLLPAHGCHVVCLPSQKMYISPDQVPENWIGKCMYSMDRGVLVQPIQLDWFKNKCSYSKMGVAARAWLTFSILIFKNLNQYHKGLFTLILDHYFWHICS